jgi:glycosyltransferase involved in cell wall biosynthesis
MRIAYFSPFPPKRTGVALYSDYFVRELVKLMDVDCYDFGLESGGASESVRDFTKTGRIRDLAHYDSVVYQIGNNPHYHLEIYKILRHFPGIVVLHDAIIYYLFAGLGISGLTKHLWQNYGPACARDIEQIVAESPEHDILRYRTPERYPLTASLFPWATRIVVHNTAARDYLVSLSCPRPIHVLPHFCFPDVDPPAKPGALKALRKQYGVEKGELVISCLGFIGPTKRIPQVCRALATLKDRLPFRFVIVGDGDDLGPILRETGLADRTVRTGFVDEDSFSLHLQLSDIVVNLRHPSMGESSGTLTRALALKKPCIVSDDAASADLPDEAVIKISIGPKEVEELADAIERLATERETWAALGAAGRSYTETVLAAPTIATQFQRLIETEVRERAQESLIAGARELRGRDISRRLLEQSIADKLPVHLRP